MTLSLGTVPTLAPRPEIKKGGWIMDATCTSGGANLRHAKFYRVAAVDDSTLDTTGQLVLDLQTPITRSDGLTAAYTGTLVVLDGVSEVFRRPQLGGPQIPTQ